MIRDGATGRSPLCRCLPPASAAGPQSAHTTRICAPITRDAVIFSAAPNGGSSRLVSLWINHALRTASDVKAAGVAAPQMRA